MKRLASALTVSVALAIAPVVHAQLAVFDPANWAQAVAQVAQLEQQYAQLVQTYQTLRGQYDLMTRMATRVPGDMRSRYHVEPTAWGHSYATNLYGTSGPWTDVLNGYVAGAGAFDAYRRATEPLRIYGTALTKLPVEQAVRATRQYASAELLDAATIRGMRILGRVRGNAHGMEEALTALDADSLSGQDDFNTQIAVLNKINAVDLVAVRTAQDTNKLLIGVLEGQLAEAKRHRDAAAQEINAQIEWQMRTSDWLGPIAGTTTTLRGFRFP